MRTFLAAVLSIIAAGVLLIAYGLLAPRAIAAPGMVDSRAPGSVIALDPNQYPAYATARPVYASDRVVANDDLYAPRAAAYPQRVMYVTQPAPAPRRVVTSIDRRSGRDWKKTALVIGGSTAAGAGVGGIFGGKTGALIGAAIGGGVSSLVEANHR
ncbi:MAG TPA: hypothetical protein VGY57_06130 [Vicinamibacterales bacterium]|nr:hypothetical protein [Vicinamibacterales bacterium]